jgi:hypothetical protein
MQRSRRTVLVALPALLAGCGRSLRPNSVPGGLFIENRRDSQVTITVQAAVLPPKETAIDETPSPTPETPGGDVVESPEVSGTYDVGGGEDKAVPDFFPRAGRWAVEAVLESEGTNTDFGRARIELHASIPGPTGADGISIEIDEDGLTAEASTVD